MMHERITIAGVAISQPACALLRNCMSTKGRQLGTVMYDLRHDEMVVNLYKHSKLIDIFEQWGYLRHGIPGFFAVGAALIYMETARMLDLYERREKYSYLFNELEFGPLTRAAQFFELATTECWSIQARSVALAMGLLPNDGWQRKAGGRYWSDRPAQPDLECGLQLLTAYRSASCRAARSTLSRTCRARPQRIAGAVLGS